LIEKIQQMYLSEEFMKVDSYSKRFDLFKVMGVQDKELVHSNILSSFFNPDHSHGLKHTFINNFLRSFSNKKPFVGNPISLSTIISASNTNVKVYRELYNIDILIVFPRAKVVLGIENKINAIEQDGQLDRYRAIISRKYKGYTSFFTYLTPAGSDPTTANDEKIDVPVYCMSYAEIAGILKLIKPEATFAANHFIDQLVYHLESYMSGNDETKEICWLLFQRHKEAYELITDNLEYCQFRKAFTMFQSLETRIKGEAFEGNCSDVDIIKINDQKNIHLDLNIRRHSWPAGVFVKIYKHDWFGIFPFVGPEDTNMIKECYNIKAIPAKNWSGFYYFSDETWDKERCITKKGNSFEDMHANIAIEKLKKLIAEIDRFKIESPIAGGSSNLMTGAL